MLVRFKERGCSKCPFNISFECDDCSLDKENLEGGTLDLRPNDDIKPEGCPFRTGDKVEVVATEHD